MPIYEYRCETCDHELEALQKISEDPLTDCPGCGAATLRKKISAAGFQLKGSGWYVTDFRDKGKKQDAKPSEAGSEAKPAAESAKPESKSETKEAAAPAPKPKSADAPTK